MENGSEGPMQTVKNAGRLVWETVLVLGMITANAFGAPPDPGLSRMLSAEVARFPGKLTVYIKQLSTGKEAVAAADEPMSSMSIIKLGILAKAYQMAERGALDLDSRVVLQPSQLRGGSGIFQYHAPGLNPTL